MKNRNSKIMKFSARYFFITPLLLVATTGFAAAQPWSLEQCISYAIDHNMQVKMQELNLSSRETELNTAQRSWLPAANASVGQTFNFGRGQDREGKTVDVNSQNTSFSLSANMPLFTGFQITNNIHLQRYTVQAAGEALRRAKESIAVSVAQAYLDVLLRKEIHKIGSEALSFTTESVKRTEAMVSTGKAPQAQLFEIRSQQASDESTLTTADNNVRLCLLTLAQLLEIASLDSFDVQLPALDSATLMLMPLAEVSEVYGSALGTKPQIREAELQVDVSRARLKVAQAGHYPQLSLNAGVGDNYYLLNSMSNASFGSQMSNNLQEYVGLSLSIPIFNRFATRNSVRSAQININYQELELESVKKTLYKEIQQAYHSAVAAQKSYLASQKSVAAAREAFRYADSKYQTGKSSVYEFTEAATRLSRSLSEEAQAKYSYVFALKILDFYGGREIRL